MFDVDLFMERLAARGLRTSALAPAPSQVVSVKAGSYRDLLSVLNTTYSAQQHIRWGDMFSGLVDQGWRRLWSVHINLLHVRGSWKNSRLDPQALIVLLIVGGLLKLFSVLVFSAPQAGLPHVPRAS